MWKYTDVPKIRIFRVLCILRSISQGTLHETLRIHSTIIKARKSFSTFWLFYVFTIQVLYKYWGTVPEDNPRKRVETWMRSSGLIVKHFVFNIVQFWGILGLYFINITSFRKQIIKHKICVFCYLYKFCLKHFLCKKNWARCHHKYTRVGTLIVATIYLQLIQNRYMFRSFTVLQCSHQHCVQSVASDVEFVGYL